ncbi:MAG: protein tyrosine phosphatase family protein [Roseiflexaceae bacterium]
MMAIEEIYQYRKVDDQLSTGGQPTEQHLRAVAEQGFRTVINLAPSSPRYSLEDEAGLVRSLGMGYHHIPVEWDNPTASDFSAFEALMQALPSGKTFIHCAANFRVSAFYSLYAQKHLGWSAAQADVFRASIWQGSDHPIWDAFIGQMQTQIANIA